jgi:hypothetical protein
VGHGVQAPRSLALDREQSGPHVRIIAARAAAGIGPSGPPWCETGAMTNRLAGSTSPYLLQHKDNPVHWWPWVPEAFAEAVRRDVPVLLSVGYAACHWCHEVPLLAAVSGF